MNSTNRRLSVELATPKNRNYLRFPDKWSLAVAMSNETSRPTTEERLSSTPSSSSSLAYRPGTGTHTVLRRIDRRRRRTNRYNDIGNTLKSINSDRFCISSSERRRGGRAARRSINNETLIGNRSDAPDAGGVARRRPRASATTRRERGSIPRPVAMETTHGNERRNRLQ